MHTDAHTHFSADTNLLPVQMSVELIPYEELKWGRFLGRGAEGAVYAAWYLETPVAVKRPESKAEVEMNLHSGTPCHVMSCSHEVLGPPCTP